MKFLITFIILSIINVVFSTIRSITTIKSGKTVASLISGGYFAFYNIMLIYTVSDFPMWEKCVITFICNVAGVWVVKFIEEKMRKDKIWKVEATVKEGYSKSLSHMLDASGISYNKIDVTNEHYTFNIYCYTKEESLAVKEILKRYDAKYFVSETKFL